MDKECKNDAMRVQLVAGLLLWRGLCRRLANDDVLRAYDKNKTTKNTLSRLDNQDLTQ